MSIRRRMQETVAERRGWLVAAVAALWVVVTLAGIGAALLVDMCGGSCCQAEQGDSNFGELEWSTLPPGPQCVWTERPNGFDATRGPSPLWSVWVLSSAALFAGVIIAVRYTTTTSSPGRLRR